MRSIYKGVAKGDVNRLSNLSKKISKKTPDKIQKVFNKALEWLERELKNPHSQELFVAFVADLCQIKNQELLIDLFNRKILTPESIKKTFISAFKENQGERALKMAMADPDLIFEYIDEKKNAYEAFNEKALNFLLASGEINDEFLMRHLPENE
jgi:hypothetical protein